MDKYTQFANKILSETLAPIEEYGPVMSSSEDFEFTPGMKPKQSKRMQKYKRVEDNEGIDLHDKFYELLDQGKRDEAKKVMFQVYEHNPEVYKDLYKAFHEEEAENVLDASDLKTLETVKALAGGKAKGGLNPFNNLEKAIQKAYGQMLNKISKQVKQVAKKI